MSSDRPEFNKNIMKKFTNSTSTDLHLDMLADPTKIKKVHENKVSSISSSSSLSTSSDSDTNKTDDKMRKVQNSVMNMVNKGGKGSINTEKNNSTAYFGPKKDMNSERNKLFNNTEIPFNKLPQRAQKFKKLEKFAKLMHLKNNCGIQLTQNYSLNSSYEDMEFELKYHTDTVNKNKGVDLCKNFICHGVTAMEFLNSNYDPFGFKLGGWSDHMKVGIDDYDEVLGELYDKYKGHGRKIEPELKLLLMVATSAATYHASKTLGGSIPGLDDVLKNNPELLSKLNNTISGNRAAPDRTQQVNKVQQELYEQMLREREQQEEVIRQQDNDNDELRGQNLTSKQRIEAMHNNQVRNNRRPGNLQGPSNLGDILKKIKSNNRVKSRSNSRVTLSDTISSDAVSDEIGKRGIRRNNVIKIAT